MDQTRQFSFSINSRFFGLYQKKVIVRISINEMVEELKVKKKDIIY